MFAEERRAEIAKLVSSARRVNGADLARRYDVTMETVRRDLAALEEAELRRVHGGAVTVGSTLPRVPYCLTSGHDYSQEAPHRREGL